MPACNNCEEVVTREFVRVFGTEGEVYACSSCATVAELVEGAGADEGYLPAG